MNTTMRGGYFCVCCGYRFTRDKERDVKQFAVFIDGSNFGSSCNVISRENEGWRPDYHKIRSYFGKRGDVVGCYYFTALPPENEQAHLRKLTDHLQYNGWTLVTKETKSYVDNGVVRLKGNMDTDIVVEAFKMSEYISDLVLFSGDGDFTSMVKELQTRAVRVTAVSILSRDSTSMVADELRRAVSQFIDLRDMAKEIALEREQDVTAKPALKYLRGR